ncbi:glycosyltransferase family 1 protein [Catenulispora subtropica]|uniref:glycosyltransferase family 4 protein n=1 Tax=Catenulispora subtropica TaxID=450798 RepID=UPI0031E019F3
MRIAVITESFLPRVNGVTNSVCRVLEQFAAHGHQALVVAAKPGPAEYAGHEVAAVGGFALPGYRSFVVGLPMARLVRRLREFQPDVVYLASPVSLGWAGATAARRLGIPCVAVFQTDVAGFARRYGLRGTDKVIWSWLRRIHAQAELTLVPSTATMKLLDDHGFPRLALWRRGVDAERFHPRYRDERLRHAVAPNRETVVGYVGRLAPEKRVDLLANLSGLPGIRLVVVGDGPAEGRLREALPTATFTGFLDGLELSRAYASLDVFVHTGADETFCQSVQEAMASGVPVVAPAAGGPLDLVTPGRTGLLYEPDSVYELRAAVMRLAANRDLRDLYGLNARAEVEGRTWSAVGDQLLRHLEAVVGGHGPVAFGTPSVPVAERSGGDAVFITTTIAANAGTGSTSAAQTAPAVQPAPAAQTAAAQLAATQTAAAQTAPPAHPPTDLETAA